MKAKYLTIIALATAGVFSSCNMDIPPIGSLDEETAIQTITDVESFRNVFYSGIRGISSSDFLVYSDIQTDMFNGLVINGNRMGTLANGVVLPSDGDITSYWNTLYEYINNANFFFEKAEPVLKKYEEANDVEKVQKVSRYIGEVHFFRGYFYAIMFDRWCVAYTPAIGDQPGMGLPIVTEYRPSPDRSTYKGRSTMNETIKFIKDEFDLALKAIMEWEEIDDSALTPMANYISSYAIQAMQARFALWIGDYDTAIAKSQAIINSKIYQITNVDNYAKMWTNDMSNEIIFMPFESQDELSGSIGSAWIGSQSNQADYVPSSNMISNLQLTYNNITKSGDVRYLTFIKVRNLSTNYGSIGTPCFNKFPGNPALQVGSTPNLVNIPKVFRLSEQYLILAEAAYNKGDNNTSNAALNTLRMNRYTPAKGQSLNYEPLSGNDLLREIQFQRSLELVGEGFRMSDLRRWKMGFTRSANYSALKYPGLTGVKKDEIGLIINPTGAQVIYTADDHRYTWPIPSDEFDVNPQIRGQQNPGY